MTEHETKYSRVVRMIRTDGQGWDVMSREDKDAVHHVLCMVNALANEIATLTGEAIPSVLERIQHSMMKSDND